METKLNESELEMGLRSVLDRVRGGERIVVERDGDAIAVIASPEPKPGITLPALAAALAHLPPLDDDFAADVEAARAFLGPAEIPEWPD